MNTTEKDKLRQRIRRIAGLTDDERSALISLLNESKTYGLVWEEKPEDVEEQLREKLPVLREVSDRAIITDNHETPNHILIEGDNLVSLSALAYTHAGKIDVIYIDPPYNTGNKDFIYNDSFVDSEDSYRHSKWLSFMSKRLKIAKKLLSNHGVIFISIDDNEQANLKLLCDEIFGERNFIAKFDWRKKTGANDAKDIAIVTESILCYSKNRLLSLDRSIWGKDVDSRNNDRFKFEDEYYQSRGRYYLDTLDRGGLQYSDSMNFGITMPDGKILFPHSRSEFVRDGWIWKWSKDKVKWGLENGFLVFVKSKKNKHTQYTIKYKVYENVDNDGKVKQRVGRAYSNLIVDYINQLGNKDMTDIFDGLCPFSNPKPMLLIRFLLNTINLHNALILDFFAGSGTTLHAVMQLNSEDGGKRRCILCTNNENGICENVTYERNRRVIQGYTKPNGEEVAGLADNNLRYYRTEFVDRRRTPQNMRRLMLLSSDMLCIKENLYTEHDNFLGLPTLKNGFRYFTSCNPGCTRTSDAQALASPSLARDVADDSNQMLIVYNEESIYQLIDALETAEIAKPIVVYIFCPGTDAWEAEFEDVADKVRLTALPQAIYNAYMRVLPKPKDHFIVSEEEKYANGSNRTSSEKHQNDETATDEVAL